jgi:hypothetical protein
MRLCAAVLVLVLPTLAHADERHTVVSIGGALGAMGVDGGPDHADSGQPIGSIRATLAFEREPPSFGDVGKSKFSGSFVPELVAGGFLEDDRAEGFVGVGLRAEVRAAHNQLAPFGWTYKVAGYLSARAVVLGGTQDHAYEFGLGEYFVRRSGFTRAGFELSVLLRPDYMSSDQVSAAGLFSLFAGWAP